jgi:hypothetical protein
MSTMAMSDDAHREGVEEEKPIIVIDEPPEVAVEEPTFAGMRRETRLEEAYDQAIDALRNLYGRRYRNQPPKDDKDLFLELENEVVLPQAALIGKLVRIVHDKEGHSPEEERIILVAAEEFLLGVARLS